MTGEIINPQAPPVKSYHQRKLSVGYRSCVRHPATRRDLTQSAAIVCCGSRLPVPSPGQANAMATCGRKPKGEFAGKSAALATTITPDAS